MDGEPRTLTFREPRASKTTKEPQSIRLRDIELQPLILLYGHVKGRTVLAHPKLAEARFTLTANPSSKPEALFANQQISAIPDGDRFVMLVPYSLTNQATPGSDEFAQSGPALSALSIDFQGVPLDKGLEVYGKCVGHRWQQNGPWNPVYLVQVNSLSKGQICYAMNTMFAWNGIRVVTNKDNTLGWDKLQ